MPVLKWARAASVASVGAAGGGEMGAWACADAACSATKAKQSRAAKAAGKRISARILLGPRPRRERSAARAPLNAALRLAGAELQRVGDASALFACRAA